MLVLNSIPQETRERALRHAAQYLPEIIEVETGVYSVSSEDATKTYTVSFTHSAHTVYATCTCEAHRRNQLCKHIAAAAVILKANVKARANAQRAAAA